ncbi:ArsR family transcriptional regulator [Stenotrophomonas maltophilia]|uniref:VpaChn25_0724 family phage protein n=1 Tax=Stenotrophomonas maltophilia TaxID=40324 RepID=UPI0039C27745
MTHITFAERMREDRRLVLLRLLVEQNGYRANSSTLHAGLDHLAVAATRDDVLTDLTWLGEQGLVRTSEAVPGVLVAQLTQRGQDTANGMTSVPGVRRPSAR